MLPVFWHLPCTPQHLRAPSLDQSPVHTVLASCLIANNNNNKTSLNLKRMKLYARKSSKKRYVKPFCVGWGYPKKTPLYASHACLYKLDSIPVGNQNENENEFDCESKIITYYCLEIKERALSYLRKSQSLSGY